MKKITLLLAAICTCNLALAQGRWELLAEDARAIVEADTETKDYDAVWIKQTSKEEPTYALYDYRFDCGARTVGYNLVRVYKNNGKSVETFAGPSNRLGGIYMGRPTPSTMEEYVLRYVCDRQTAYSRNTATNQQRFTNAEAAAEAINRLSNQWQQNNPNWYKIEPIMIEYAKKQLPKAPPEMWVRMLEDYYRIVNKTQ